MRALIYLFVIGAILIALAKYTFLFNTWLHWNFDHEDRVHKAVCLMVKPESLEEKELTKCTTIGQK